MATELVIEIPEKCDECGGVLDARWYSQAYIGDAFIAYKAICMTNIKHKYKRMISTSKDGVTAEALRKAIRQAIALVPEYTCLDKCVRKIMVECDD